MATDKEPDLEPKKSRLFAPKSDKALAKQIERNQKRSAKAQNKILKDFIKGISKPNYAGTFVKAFQEGKRQAIAHRASTMRKPSTRLSTDAGRPFNFQHSYVKHDGSIGGGKVKVGKGQTPGAKTISAHGSQGAAHMSYLERDSAVEKDIDLARFTEVEKDELRDIIINRELGIGLEPSERSSRMQAYIEDDKKVDRDQELSFSFGTIGETPQERQDFWTLVQDHMERETSRLQNRLVLELPHEATPRARVEAVQKFCKENFEDKGLPYWAVLHSPTAKNDPRNFHAHVVFTKRPAKKIPWPEGGNDGKPNPDGSDKKLVPTWDFAAFSHLPDQNKHRRITYPNRQKIPKEYDQASFIPKMRANFAKTINFVMGKHRIDVRYDHRSYRDMGLDAKAIKSLSKGIHEGLRDNKILTKTADDQDRDVDKVQAQLVKVAFMENRRELADLEKIRLKLNRAIKNGSGPAALAKLTKPGQRIPKPQPLSTRLCAKISAAYFAHRKQVAEDQLDIRIERQTRQFLVDATHPGTMQKAIEILITKEAKLKAATLRDPQDPKKATAYANAKAMLDGSPTPDMIKKMHVEAQLYLEAFEEKYRAPSKRAFKKLRELTHLVRTHIRPETPYEPWGTPASIAIAAGKSRQMASDRKIAEDRAAAEAKRKIKAEQKIKKDRMMQNSEGLMTAVKQIIMKPIPPGRNPAEVQLERAIAFAETIQALTKPKDPQAISPKTPVEAAPTGPDNTARTDAQPNKSGTMPIPSRQVEPAKPSKPDLPPDQSADVDPASDETLADPKKKKKRRKAIISLGLGKERKPRPPIQRARDRGPSR